MKTLSFNKDRVRVLVSTDLDSVVGGQKVSSALEPTATAVSSAKPDNGGAAQPTSSAVSSARPVEHKHRHHHRLSSVKPDAGNDSSALPIWT